METRNLLKITQQNSAILLIITLAVISRLMPHPPNVAPITALALFSGAQLTGWKRFAIPLTTMVFSDIVLGLHSTIPYVYVSFIIITFIGSLIKEMDAQNIFTTTLCSSVIFFLITNLGVWISTDMYPKTIVGLRDAYVMGIPFFRNTLIGDFFYTFSLFYGCRFLTKGLLRTI